MSTKPSAKDETPLQQVSMEWAKEQILKGLFRRFRGARPDMEDRLQEAYKERYGVEMRKVTTNDVRAIYLESPPGHGKTTTHREACKEFAGLMGLKFMENPTLQQMQRGLIDDNSFVFSTLNLGGATSKHEVGGMMAKLKVGDQEFMGHLPDWRMAATLMGSYGYVLFDDFVTSSHQVQNACLDMLLGGSAGDMQFNMKDMAASKIKVQGGQVVMEFDPAKEEAINAMGGGDMVRGSSPVHIGLAGNRGIRDGNKTFPIVTATATRIQRMDVFDTPEAFIERSLRKHSDEISDGNYSAFLRQFPELFTIVAKPINGVLPQMPCPRTHDALMDSICDLLHDNGGVAKIAGDPRLQENVVTEIERLAGTHIGKEIQLEEKGPKGETQYAYPAAAVAGFYNELLLGAAPKAEEIIKRGIVDEAFIKTKYNMGSDGDGVNFGYQFSSALANLAASQAAESIKKLSGKNALDQMSNPDSEMSLATRETLKNFSMGMSFLQKPLVTFALDRFVTRLSNLAPEIFEGKDNFKILPAQTMRTMMYGLVKDNTKYNTRELAETFALGISSYSTVAGNDQSALLAGDLNERRKKSISAAKAAL